MEKRATKKQAVLAVLLFVIVLIFMAMAYSRNYP